MDSRQVHAGGRRLPPGYVASLRILIVDAKRSLRRAWRALLESTFPGCVVEEIPDATEAWGRVRTRMYDLILADERLPDGSGLALLEKARDACPGAIRVLLADPPAGEEVRRGVVHGVLPRHAPLADATDALRRLVEAGPDE